MEKRVQLMTVIFVCVFIAVVGCIVGTSVYASHERQTLLVYSGAGLKCVMDELGKEFEIETRVDVDIIYGGSGHIFGQLSTTKRGDIFIPGAEYYTRRGIEEGLLYENLTRNVTYHIPLILVREGNPKNITTLEDLARPGIKVALGSVEQCAIGRLSNKLLEQQGLYEEIKANNLEVTTATVNELLTYVAMGTVDAAIVWEDNVGTLVEQGKVDVIEIEPSKNIIKTIPVSVTKYTKDIKLTDDFADFCCSKEGLEIWEEKGFKSYAG